MFETAGSRRIAKRGGLKAAIAMWREAGDYGKFASFAPIWNYSIAVAAASNNLTITINDKDGNAPSTTSPIVANFRSPTATTGSILQRQSSSALSFTINSGNTMGTASNQPFRLHLALFDDAGTLVLGAMCAVVGGATPTNVVGIDESQLLNTQSGTNGGGTAGVWYAATDLSSGGPFAMRYLGFIECNSTSFTAGSWGTSGAGLISKAQLAGPGVPRPGERVQRAYGLGTSQNNLNGTTKVSAGNASITPTSKVSVIVARAAVAARNSDQSYIASFQLSRGSSFTGIGNVANFELNIGSSITAYASIPLLAWDAPATTSSVSYYAYAWFQSGSATDAILNSNSGTTSIELEEIAA